MVAVGVAAMVFVAASSGSNSRLAGVVYYVTSTPEAAATTTAAVVVVVVGVRGCEHFSHCPQTGSALREVCLCERCE